MLINFLHADISGLGNQCFLLLAKTHILLFWITNLLLVLIIKHNASAIGKIIRKIVMISFRITSF